MFWNVLISSDTLKLIQFSVLLFNKFLGLGVEEYIYIYMT